MSDFDAFEDSPTPAASDPAADFLANQQQKLQGLLDDDFSGAGSVPQADVANQQGLFGFDQQPQATSGNASYDLLGAATGTQDSGDFGFGMGMDSVQGVSGNAGFGGETGRETPQHVDGGKSDMYAAIRTEMGESDKLRQWREAQRERLAKKDDDESSRRKECYASAKQELEDWYKHYDEQLGKTRAANLDMEKMLVAERAEPLPTGPGQQAALWERVCRNCDFNPKNTKCQKDISRFRSLLLSLKQTPPIRT